jgi:hypothetical protein
MLELTNVQGNCIKEDYSIVDFDENFVVFLNEDSYKAELNAIEKIELEETGTIVRLSDYLSM